MTRRLILWVKSKRKRHVCSLESLHDTPYGISECECGLTFSLADVAAMEWEVILK